MKAYSMFCLLLTSATAGGFFGIGVGIVVGCGLATVCFTIADLGDRLNAS